MTARVIEFVLTLQDAPLASAGALIAAFILGALVFVPRIPLCLAGGLTLGFAALPIAAVSATAGAVLAFLASRYLLRSRFAEAIRHRPAWQAIIEATDHEGWRLIFLLRLASPVPGAVTNYLFGLTRIGLGRYTAATFIGQLPQIFVFVYLGAVGRSALTAEHGSSISLAMLIIGLVLTGLAVFLVVRRVRSRLARHHVS
jgi:uncharacterized membrane protein YdjX (TVP38/TMEM64 family)